MVLAYKFLIYIRYHSQGVINNREASQVTKGKKQKTKNKKQKKINRILLYAGNHFKYKVPSISSCLKVSSKFLTKR